MQLYLDSYGAYLSVKNGMFQIRLRNSEDRAFAARNVQAILLTKGTGMSTDAALLAIYEDIPVLLIDANTHYPLGTVSGVKTGSIATIRKNQAVWSRTGAGFEWVSACIAQKIERQITVLHHLSESKEATTPFLEAQYAANKIIASALRDFVQWKSPKENLTATDITIISGHFRGVEGTASRIYFQQISRFLEGRMDFDGRGKKPAYDPFNALLNYLYGMLYTHVHLALLKSGLDPYMGVLHVDQYGDRPTLAFDAIEPYRPWADSVALTLVQKGVITESFFIPSPESSAGLWLSGLGKSTVIDAMLDYLASATPYYGQNRKRSVQIDLEAQRLAARLKDYISPQ
jgi:CRISP-associated protein Cas1